MEQNRSAGLNIKAVRIVLSDRHADFEAFIRVINACRGRARSWSWLEGIKVREVEGIIFGEGGSKSESGLFHGADGAAGRTCLLERRLRWIHLQIVYRRPEPRHARRALQLLHVDAVCALIHAQAVIDVEP